MGEPRLVNERGNGGTINTQKTYQATGEVTSITRSGTNGGGSVNYARFMTYDSLGRLVINDEPNTSNGALNGKILADRRAVSTLDLRLR